MHFTKDLALILTQNEICNYNFCFMCMSGLRMVIELVKTSNHIL